MKVLKESWSPQLRSTSYLPSGFKLESLAPTAAAAKSHSYRAYIAMQQLLAVPRQRCGNGGTLSTYSQSTATVVNRKQWPTSSDAGYLMSLAPRRPHHRHREGNGMCPHVATPCVKDTREKKWNNGYGTICAQLTGVGNTGTRV